MKEKIIKLARYLSHDIKNHGDGNVLIIQKILDEINKIDTVEDFHFSLLSKYCEYIVKNSENQFAKEMIEQYTHEVASYITNFEISLMDSQELIRNISEKLNIKLIDIKDFK